MISSLNDDVYMQIAHRLSRLSTDRSRKTSCVFVDNYGTIRASGVNRFVLGLHVEEGMHERPYKYNFTEHAERVAAFAAAREGVALSGTTAYVPWFPCVECARCLVEVEIQRLVCHEPDWEETQYKFRDAERILQDGGVQITFVERPDGEI